MIKLLPIRQLACLCACLCATGCLSFSGNNKADDAKIVPASSNDPLNTTYVIEEEIIRLTDGYHEKQAAPGSATKIKTMVFGRPVQGDLDGDGDDDAGVVIVQDSGGSGTFYYAAAALNMNGSYTGTHGVLLGDRIVPQAIQISNGVFVANYADRQPNESMATPPSIARTKYLTLKKMKLEEIKPLGNDEQLMQGWVTIAHEVRSFKPCPSKTDFWILGESPALKKIIAGYRESVPNKKLYAPLFMTLVGKYDKPPTGGFGSEYEGAILATQLVQVWPQGNCNSEPVVFDSLQKIAFDMNRLDTNGLYGPPGGKRALSYEFCIPNTGEHKAEIKNIDPTVQCTTGSPGRIGCDGNESLCIGSTHQKNYRSVVQRLAGLEYVKLINECFFE